MRQYISNTVIYTTQSITASYLVRYTRNGHLALFICCGYCCCFKINTEVNDIQSVKSEVDIMQHLQSEKTVRLYKATIERPFFNIFMEYMSGKG